MKLLYLCNMVPKLGSLEQQLAAIARHLRGEGEHHVEFVFGGPVPVKIADLLADAGAQWSVLKGWTDEQGVVRPWRFVVGTLKRIRATRPDVAVVHFGNEWPAVIALILSRVLGFGRTIRWVWVQDQRIRDPSRLAALCSRIRLVGLFFDAVVAVSEAGARSLLLRGVPVSKIRTILNSVTAYESGKPEGWLYREAGFPADAIVATCVSSLIPRKRVDKVIRAVARAIRTPHSDLRSPISDLRPPTADYRQRTAVSDQRSAFNVGAAVPSGEENAVQDGIPPTSSLCPPTSDLGPRTSDLIPHPSAPNPRPSALYLLILGDGPERPRLESLAQELGLVDRVRFMGKRDDVRDILAQSDFLVHAAIAEGCAYAILESMAAGIPAIVTDSGAAREQIEDGASGFVVAPENQDQFEQAVALLAGDAALRAKMGNAARERWRSRFQTDQSAKTYAELFLKKSEE